MNRFVGICLLSALGCAFFATAALLFGYREACVAFLIGGGAMVAIALGRLIIEMMRDA